MLQQLKMDPSLRPIDLISQRYRIELTDGRSLEVLLIAIDDQGNLLVSDVNETNGGVQRQVGLVSIRKKYMKKIFASSKCLDKLQAAKREKRTVAH
mgnify:CR=1 FL=1